jgi:hypothetical protein
MRDKEAHGGYIPIVGSAYYRSLNFFEEITSNNSCSIVWYWHGKACQSKEEFDRYENLKSFI